MGCRPCDGLMGGEDQEHKTTRVGRAIFLRRQLVDERDPEGGSVLLFYCCQTSELRCAAMSDLRHRILVLDQRQVIYHPYQQRNCPYAPPENCNSLSST
ncbi:hypothetical protein VPH35_094585 [Triticum aestivum]